MEWTTVTHKKKHNKVRSQNDKVIKSIQPDYTVSEIQFPSPSHYKSKVTYETD